MTDAIGTSNPDPLSEWPPIDFSREWVEVLLGHEPSMDRRAVSRRSQVSERSAARLWHALGFPRVRDGEQVFTQADVDALDRVARLVREDGWSEELALGMARAFARTTDRLSVWQTQLITEVLAEGEGQAGGLDEHAMPSAAVAQAAAAELVRRMTTLEPLLIYAWRRHLAAAITRLVADAGSDRASLVAPRRVVGFADLVSFTDLVRRMSERQLAVVVQRFEALASDVVVAHGGRVIKTVGDEVFFVHTHPAPAAAIALDLIMGMNDDPVLPEVRVGMAYGPVLARLGDVFGVTVNRASRLTAITPTGSAYVDEALAVLLKTVNGFAVSPQRRRTLRGIGSVRPSELHRTAGARRPFESDSFLTE